MQYTVDYFIKKFEAIPETLWCVENIEKDGRHCALGHCGGWPHESKESTALAKVLVKYYELTSLDLPKNHRDEIDYAEVVYNINDFDSMFSDLGATPKQRILAALYDIKKMQEPKVKEIIRYVAVHETISEMETILN